VPDTSPVRVLEAALANFRGELTVADASTKGGLPLREAEDALRVLAADYARATSPPPARAS
jgi:Fic family protein